MRLPKIDYPIATVEIPIVNKVYQFRPMLVKEEKILLMAKQSEKESDIIQSIKQIVNNCCVDPNFDIDSLPLFALEYLFLKLRSFSIGNEVSVSYRDYEDNKVYDFSVNLESVIIKVFKEVSNRIEISKTAGLVLKYPTASIYADAEFIDSLGEQSYYKLVAKCVESVYDAENVYESKDFKDSELTEFIESLDIKTFDKIREFMNNIPTLYHEINYKNEINNERKVVMKSLSDFFTLR
jgi:hypothetical protein